jgi:hypothetical protein
LKNVKLFSFEKRKKKRTQQIKNKKRKTEGKRDIPIQRPL